MIERERERGGGREKGSQVEIEESRERGKQCEMVLWVAYQTRKTKEREREKGRERVSERERERESERESER